MVNDQEVINNTRRRILKGAGYFALASIGGASAGVGAPKLAKFILDPNLQNKIIGATEVATSVLESNLFNPNRKIGLLEKEQILTNQVFAWQQYRFIVGNETKSVDFIRCFGTPSIQIDEDYSRMGVLQNTSFGVNLPITQCVGNYYRNGKMINPIPITPARDVQSNWIGPEKIVDRFPGLGELGNALTGGIVVLNGNLNIVNNTGLANFIPSGVQFAQSVYAFDSNDRNLLLKLNWTHHRMQLPIGATSYWWGMIVQNQNNTDEWGYVVNADPNQYWAIYDIARATEQIFNAPSTLALCDGGNGSTAILKHQDNLIYVGVNEGDYHFTPLSLNII